MLLWHNNLNINQHSHVTEITIVQRRRRNGGQWYFHPFELPQTCCSYDCCVCCLGLSCSCCAAAFMHARLHPGKYLLYLVVAWFYFCEDDWSHTFYHVLWNKNWIKTEAVGCCALSCVYMLTAPIYCFYCTKLRIVYRRFEGIDVFSLLLLLLLLLLLILKSNHQCRERTMMITRS